MDEVKVEIPGVDVQGTLKPGNLFETLAAMLSMKFDKQIAVTTRPPAWMEQKGEKPGWMKKECTAPRWKSGERTRKR